MRERELTTEDLAHAADTSAEVERRPEPDAAEVEADDGRHARGDVSAADRGAAAASAGDARDDAARAHASGEPLLPSDESERFASRWQDIQASFVDEPRASVEQADALVADLMQRLAASFSDERRRLEAQWDSGDDVSTEDLRVALTRYRSFFERLLAA